MSAGKVIPVKDVESQQDIVDTEDFRKATIDIVRPALLNDVQTMVKGRKWWLKMSTVFETLGKIAAASGVVLAFASGSDIVGSTASQALGFTAGAVGTSGLVLSGFANFARTQSIERGDALDSILAQAKLRQIPDVADHIEIQANDQ